MQNTLLFAVHEHRGEWIPRPRNATETPTLEAATGQR